ncbi:MULTISPECIES: hypothetical protein [Streptomyces]|uniref:Uncharacterized protein n=1 Tax=Streptomyces stelliscabiei TaxID=146820 RepID=A0A8I0P0U8_9ACTN|nr:MULTISPECIES: hypothetical protein [Streptomyces]MBE1595332.1 hypothetical protein [Streptomyces stelliscabiei]MDX2516285.1 hypothetical protein [Streptomyces stelliscabiei]MDX2557862.1 hypothetical protein [Streptomyces stelliscabiei]MDX2612244.1 hypothetical protein [Streptomyces stelliscabiei]MDX2636582.1 hypothetical protein [Streptomyces stelliscabiei]
MSQPPTRRTLVGAVRALADAWVSEGRLTGAERDAVVAVAVRAGLRR